MYKKHQDISNSYTVLAQRVRVTWPTAVSKQQLEQLLSE